MRGAERQGDHRNQLAVRRWVHLTAFQLAVAMRLYKQQIMVGHAAVCCLLKLACRSRPAVLCCSCRADGCMCPCPALRCGEEAAPQARRRGAGEWGQQGCIERCLGSKEL